MGLDFSWTDLTLGFLWWPDPKMVGMAKKKGRPCFVVDVPSPVLEPAGAYAGMRLWIDTHVNVLLQAEGYDTKGDVVRRMTVKSFQRIDDLWTIKNLHVQSLPSGHKTTLRVRDLKVEGQDVSSE